MKTSATFTANIYVGLKHGYDDAKSSYRKKHTSIEEVREWVQDYCNKVKLGVTLTPTEFIYVDGNEPGVIIGLIQYPRFPQPTEFIEFNALAIARGLMKLCSQERVSIIFPDQTVMLEKDDY